MNYQMLAAEFLKNSRGFRQRRHQKQIDEKMHGESYALLYLLIQNRQVTPSALSAEMHVSTARTAALLNGLEEKGLITRGIDQADRRRILVTLTDAGKEMAERHQKMVVESTARMLKCLGEADARELVRLTGRLAALAPDCYLDDTETSTD